MANSILGIGISGLSAAQAGLQTTSHNITNVNTPGYSRQSILQANNLPQYTGAGYFGRGVSVTDVRRSYDAFLQAQSWQAQASSAQMQTFSDQISQVDSLLGDSSAGLSPAISSFFNSVQDLASNPSDYAARQAMLSQAQALAARFQSINGQLDAQRSDVSSRVTDTVSQVNTLAAQIAAVNHRILASNAGSATQGQPNDLLDQRDELVSELSKLVNVQVNTASDGSYNVLIGNGQPLVMGDGASKLAVVAGDPDPAQVQVVVKGAAGTVKIASSNLSGGQLGGLLSFRDTALNTAQNALGRIAVALSTAFNDQNKLGQDLNGNLGGNIFNAGQPLTFSTAANTGTATLTAGMSSYGALTGSDYQLSYDGTNYTLKRLSDGNVSTFASLPQSVDGVTLSIASGSMAAGDSFLIEPTRAGAGGMRMAITDPSLIAAAQPIQAAAALGNSGTVAADSTTVSGPPPDPNLQQTVTITFTSPTTFDVSGTGTGNPTGLTYTPGGSISFNGWTLQMSGVPAAGDTLTVKANTGGGGDNRNALALANLQNAALVGGTSLQNAYVQLVSAVGNQAQDAKVASGAQAALFSSVEQARQGVSGVNLDEEAANLLRYQQAYQAAGKIIAMAGTLFDTILKLEG
ncbi:MAG TPA: flagellar hook-associated protein FlgK [Burkholderiales bacterium]|nr:flagellar hook-associated protein FlgK [Burkholderiales bacterium]